ncbi:HepT-like ribonuclease domain-containing protein [Flavobacterium subsaxonicum]|uniref:Antitoxin n=1 Tax=Flavobacterium subsaxonicum WB 4.1-42 = DSM 21790 TaxID=1121898 RepID=A0A0A2MT83_9FLAO|nr:HepT-like ribonuclease domain-containing protein [Flavobacterium subsaxonicum]KGO94806.1 hypothetical protein Q766_01445 [Flavobacterium subsaxonicum WB 4.1-42 = DSM 21790]
MTERARKYLFDILFAIEMVENFLESTPTFFLYENDLKTKSAVERQLGIIGEAVNKFEKEQTGYPLSYSREIVNFRNRLIHAYDSIDDSVVWAIKTNHLPLLKAEIEKISKLN